MAADEPDAVRPVAAPAPQPQPQAQAQAQVARRWRRWLVRALLAGAVVFGTIQLVPYGRDHDNPPVTEEPVWPSAVSERLARGACYDCHSNETEWPWYSNVAPMSWLVQQDVDRGRDAVNFSEWPSGDEVDELHDAVENRSMPPRQYTFNHPAARLSAAEREQLIEALRAIENQAEGGDGGGDNSGPGSGDDSGQGRGRGRSGGEG